MPRMVRMELIITMQGVCLTSMKSTQNLSQERGQAQDYYRLFGIKLG